MSFGEWPFYTDFTVFRKMESFAKLKKMNYYMESAWEWEICSKKSLKYLNPRSVAVGTIHVCWSSVRHNIRDNRRAELKVKLLNGPYILHANRSCFNQYVCS